MSACLTQAHRSQQASKRVTAKPEDREIAAKARFRAADMTALASGAFTSVESGGGRSARVR